jgi:hypothetical protein
MFKEAMAHSPNKSIDIVIANAGIGGIDPIYKLDGLFSAQKATYRTNLHLKN